ncbi:MAG: CopG family transcriptional regulator [Desulfopila sp.]
MGQITIYLDDKDEAITAKASNKSVSKWIAELIKEKMATEWPEDIVKLAGSWGKGDFPSIEELRANSDQDIPREAL